jgi:hypothetical protein
VTRFWRFSVGALLNYILLTLNELQRKSANFLGWPRKRPKMHFSSKKAYQNAPVGFSVFTNCGKMVTMMKYKTVNQRDERGGGRDENCLCGFIRGIRAIRGSLSELDHGFHGFLAARPRSIWVRPSRTQPNRRLSCQREKSSRRLDLANKSLRCHVVADGK